MALDILTELLDLPQVEVLQYTLPDAERLVLTLGWQTDLAVCPTCAHISTAVHGDYGAPRTVRDLDIGGRRCYLRFTPRQFKCAQCQDTFVERLMWLEPRQHLTRRLENTIYALIRRTNVIEAVRHYGESEDVVRSIFVRHATAQVTARGYPLVNVLHVDEIAPHKGHGNYQLILSSPEVGVLDVLENRLKATLEAWFAERGPEWCAAVQEFHTDMWRAYHDVARAQLPNVPMTTADHFHVIDNLNTALGEVRKTIQRTADSATREVLKGSRWLVLKSREALTEQEQEHLDIILDAVPALACNYTLKEDFRAIYQLRDPQAAAEALDQWLEQARTTGHTAMQTFVNTVTNWREEILSYFRTRGSNGFAEGVNNKIKLVLRRAFGCPNFEHFRLRIIVAFGA